MKVAVICFYHAFFEKLCCEKEKKKEEKCIFDDRATKKAR